MKNKHWLFAILIVGILALAFFWGGSEHPTTTKPAEKSSAVAQTTVEPNSPQPTKEQKKATPLIEKEPDKKTAPTAAAVAPKPVVFQEQTITKSDELTCTFSVTCKTILNNMDKLDKDKLESLPTDGIIYKTQTVVFSEGESVFDLLLREMKRNKIPMEFVDTPIYKSNYIEGIHNLYEFDCGELSGWMYKVNGALNSHGSSQHMLKNGDVVEWLYTCDLGRDIGGGNIVGGTQ